MSVEQGTGTLIFEAHVGATYLEHVLRFERDWIEEPML